MKCIFHIHTCFSKDCNTSLKEISHTCLVNDVNTVIITDHDTIDGALELMRIVDKKLRVIIGEEITTTDGEIIGLFLEEAVLPHKNAVETIADIKKQGGLVCIPHPFDSFRKERIQPNVLNKIIDSIDIIEVFNSRNIFNNDNKQALEFAVRMKKIKIAGSDAHTSQEIKNSFIDIEYFLNNEDFLSNLENAKMSANQSPFYVHLITKMIKMRKMCSNLKKIKL